jgi:hypothetical protein
MKVIDLFEALKASLEQEAARRANAKPRARCAVNPAHRPLEFSQPNPYGYQWDCSCLDCADADADEEGRMVRTDKGGWGKTPETALADYAEQCEVTVEELIMKEGT